MKYAIVGTGGRATSYIDPLVNEYHADHELVALCDPNPHRINYHRDRVNSFKPGFEVQGFTETVLSRGRVIIENNEQKIERGGQFIKRALVNSHLN